MGVESRLRDLLEDPRYSALLRLPQVAEPPSIRDGAGAVIKNIWQSSVVDARCSRKRSRPEGDEFRHAEQRAQHCAVATHRRLQGLQRSLRLDDPHGVHDPQPS